MKLQPVISLRYPPRSDVRTVLLEAAASEGWNATEWELRERADLESVKTALDQLGVENTVSFRVLPDSADLIEDMAAYLPLDSLEEDDWFEPDGLVIRMDYSDLTCVASVGLAMRFNEVAEGLVWASCSGFPHALRLAGVPNLPEPLQIPHAKTMMQGSTGMWLVQGDGIEILGEQNHDFLKEAGIAASSECVVDGKVMRRPRMPIFGGRALDIARGTEVQGVSDEPIYLLPRDL
ncbi:hypothetical protein [Streptomyces sp. NPDC056049]|uniref:hypothetical protein n=1 Tax=Streptomyces sp. NPDC056049 TaxID=3345693 RepID=UPI0035D72107